MTEKEKMKLAMWYDPNNDTQLVNERLEAQDLCFQLNQIRPKEIEKRLEIIEKILGEKPEGLELLSPFTCDYGINIKLGKNVFINVNCYFMDGATITVGNNVFIGPGCRVVQDIPDNTKVVIVNQLQLLKRKGEKSLILDGLVYDGEYLRLYGENIVDADIKIVNSQYIDRTDLQVIIIEKSKNYIAFNIIKQGGDRSDQMWKDNHIKVIKNNEYFFITSDVVERFLRRGNKQL